MLEALETAVALAGGQTQFADKLNDAMLSIEPRDPERKPVRQQHVEYWLKKSRKLPADYARAAELVVDGKVTRYEFRPDIFGASPNAGPPRQLELPA